MDGAFLTDTCKDLPASESTESSIAEDEEDAMIAAIYVRKSTAQTGMSEDARSVERQRGSCQRVCRTARLDRCR